MSTQVFFNKPLRSIDLHQLHVDIKAARQYLVLASAWFTDVDLASVFIDSTAEQKTVLFNAADMNRGTRRAYEMITSYFNNPVDWWDKEDDDDEASTSLVYTSPGSDQYGVKESDPFILESSRLRFVVLGSGDWTEGVMHHKFIICDDIVWAGSYNFTFQARRNYETLIRIDDKKIARQFRDETESLIGEPNKHYSMSANGVFSCHECGKVFSVNRLGLEASSPYHGTYYICKACTGKTEFDEQHFDLRKPVGTRFDRIA